MDISLKKLDRICLTAIILVSLICGYWVSNRTVKKYRQIRKEKVLLSKGLKGLTIAEKNLQSLNKALDAKRKELKVLSERVPESAKVGEFLKLLDSKMKMRKMQLEKFQQLPIVDEKRFTRIPIRLFFRGYFVDIYYLLYDIETMNRIVEVEEITLSNSNGSRELNVEMTTSIFKH
jgi:Tfp pilus assembly protein PilO